MTRPSSRPKKLTVVSGGKRRERRRELASTSASFQRSTPSTMRNRRPMAKVIALRASGDGLGRRVVAVEDLETAAARLRLGHRAQAGAPLADAAVIVAVNEVGGLERGHGNESRRERGYATLRLPARRSRCRRGRCGRARRPRRAARGRSTRRGGHRRCGARPRSPPAAVAGAPAAPGSPGSALPWWETLRTSTGPRSSPARTSDSASAVSSVRTPPASASATIARWLGSSPASAGPRGPAGHSTRSAMAPTRSTSPARAADHPRHGGARPAQPCARRWDRGRRRGRRGRGRPAARPAPPPRRRRGRPGRG